MHFGLFCYCTKLVAKRVELVQLVQKFVPRSRIRIFGNECTQSTPLGLKLMFWCISWCLGAFGHVQLLHETRCKICWTGTINAQDSCHEIASKFFATNAPDPPRWTLNLCFGVSHSIWVHLAMFHYYRKLGARQVELVQLMQKFVPWSCIRIFRNERTQSTPLEPKLMFCCVA